MPVTSRSLTNADRSLLHEILACCLRRVNLTERAFRVYGCFCDHLKQFVRYAVEYQEYVIRNDHV